jgi:hypothetical protein
MNSQSRLVCGKNNLIFGISAHGDEQNRAKSLRLRSLRMICYFKRLSPTDPLLFVGLARAK